MKRLLFFICAFILVISLCACTKETLQEQTKEVTLWETASDQTPFKKEHSTQKNEYIEIEDEILKVVLDADDIEEIIISDLRSAPDCYPTEKIIKDKTTKDKIIYLIKSMDFEISKKQQAQKPGTTMIIQIDDKLTLSFQGKILIDGVYCELPNTFYNHILGLYNSAPEKAEPIKY